MAGGLFFSSFVRGAGYGYDQPYEKLVSVYGSGWSGYNTRFWSAISNLVEPEMESWYISDPGANCAENYRQNEQIGEILYPMKSKTQKKKLVVVMRVLR